MKSLFLSQIATLHPIIYLVIFVIMMIEGDAVIFTSFFLVHAGIFEFYRTVIAVFSGAIIGDLLWYFVGHTSEPTNRFSLWLLNLSERLTSKFDSHLKERTFHTIFLSKFTYGLHHLLLLRTGSLHIDFKKVIKTDLVATTVWILIIGVLGYASGASFTLVKHRIQYFEIGFLGAVLIFIILGEIISRILRKNI